MRLKIAIVRSHNIRKAKDGFKGRTCRNPFGFVTKLIVKDLEVKIFDLYSVDTCNSNLK